MSENNYRTLLQKLDGFIRKYYKNQLIKGALYSISSLVLFFLVVSVAEYFGHFNSAVRATLFYSFIAFSGFILVRWVFTPLLKLYRIGSQISYDQAANLIGTHFNEINDKLTNTLQLKNQLESAPQDAALLSASIDQKVKGLTPVPFRAAIDFGQNKRYLKFAIPPILLLLLIVFGAPSIITDGTGRLVQHEKEFLPIAPFQFLIENDKLQTGELEDFPLEVSIDGDQLPGKVFIEIDDNLFKLQKKSAAQFKYLFKNVNKSTPFRLFADGFYSKEFTLEALPSPLLLNFDVALDFPSYTGKKNTVVRNTGDLVIPAGTKVKWNFNTRNTDAVGLVFSDSTLSLKQLGENLFGYSRTFLRSEGYTVSSENEFIKSKDSVRYVITVVPDQYPSIEVEEKADSNSTKMVYFQGQVRDDYGFKALSFHYRFLHSKKSEKLEQTFDPIQLSINPSALSNQFYHFWDFEQLAIEAGEQIEYYFEVWDNDEVNGSKSARTSRKVFKAPTLDELSEKAEKNSEKIKEELKESIQEAKEIQTDLEKLSRKMLEKKQLSWEEQKQFQELLEKQHALENKLDKINKENRDNQKEQREYKQSNERIMEKQQQLEELFDKVMTDEMRDLFEKMEDLLEEMDKNKLQEALDDMKLTNEDIEKELDRSLEIYKQLELQQKVEETMEKLEALKEKQEELNEATEKKEESLEKLAEKQKELEEEFEKLREDIDKIEEKNEELENPLDMPETEPTEEEIEEEMKKGEQQLQDKKQKKAQESQEKAKEKMDELSEQLQQMMSQMESQGSEEDLNALRQLLDNLVQISFNQEDLMVELKGTGQSDPRYQGITKEQKKVRDDAQVIEDSLFALSKRVVQIQSIVNREISAINSNIDKTIKFLSEQPPGQARSYTGKALERQQYVMTSFNNLALLLDEAIQAMQKAMSEQKFGEGSCNKPGSNGKPKPGFSGMKEMQKKISQQIQKMQEQMDKKGQQEGGKKPGGKKGKGKTPGEGAPGSGGQMSKELARLAAEQGALRNELRKMADQMTEGEGEGEGEGGSGEGLKKLQELMEQNEKDLVNKNITRETLKRQQEIMSKLLESEKAEREREFDEKRESQEAIDQISIDPSELFEDNNVNGKEIELLKTVPPTLEPFYKKKVNDYFNGFD